MINDSAVNSTTETGITPKNNFLPCGNQTHKEDLKTVGNPLSGTETTGCCPEQNQDYSSCSSTELREKYPRTYKCWDNMKQRKNKGAIIHKEFAKFKDFLKHLGPCEDSEYTLDRVDNSDPEYAPGKVEWRDKYAQNSNKGNNVYLTHEDGRRFSVAQWAAKTGISAATLYKRRAAGWNDMAIITGKHEKYNQSIYYNPWPYDTRKELEADYKQSIINGSGKSRLVFLRDRARNILSYIEKSLILLPIAIQQKIGFDNDEDEYNALEHIAEQGWSLKEFEGMSIDGMKELVEELKLKKPRCEHILKQTSEQVEYDEKREKLFRNRNKHVKESDFNKFYDELHPRPEYTLNRPPPNS